MYIQCGTGNARKDNLDEGGPNWRFLMIKYNPGEGGGGGTGDDDSSRLLDGTRRAIQTATIIILYGHGKCYMAVTCVNT